MASQDIESPSMNLGLRQCQLKTRQMFNKTDWTKLLQFNKNKDYKDQEFYSELYSEVDI